jgi:hypothetical protein
MVQPPGTHFLAQCFKEIKERLSFNEFLCIQMTSPDRGFQKRISHAGCMYAVVKIFPRFISRHS